MKLKFLKNSNPNPNISDLPFDPIQSTSFSSGRLVPLSGLSPQYQALQYFSRGPDFASHNNPVRKVMISRWFTTTPKRTTPQGIHDSERDVYFCNYPRFHIGHSWYPGIDPQAGLLGTMGDTQSDYMLRLTPPIITRQSNQITSIRQGIYTASAMNFGAFTYPRPANRTTS